MTVKVRRERPDQRRYHRVTAPLYLRLGDGPVVRARDWSLGGLRVDGYPEALPPVGSDVEIAVALPFQGFDISFHVKAEVVRNVGEIASFAVQFTEIGERERALMSHFIEDLVRGAMTEVADQIQRIDVPITPVSTDPSPKPDDKEAPKKRRLPVKQIAWVSIYATIGFLVFGYMALVLYSNLFRMEVQTAVVTAPLVDVRAQSDGELSFVRATPGEHVKAGETVIYVADYGLEQQIDLAKVEIQRREAELVNAMQLRTNEMERMTEYASVGLKNIEQLQVDMAALEFQHKSAISRYSRTSKLKQEGFATKAQLEDAGNWLAEARAKLKSKKIELEEQKRLAETGLGRTFYNGRELLGNMGAADAAIKLARYQVALANENHEALLKHRERLAVHAPFNGRLAEVPLPEHAAIKKGDVIAVFEKDKDRRVLAYLTQDEVMKIGLGDQASIYFPALNASLKARVISIDRTAGFRTEISRRFSWRGADDRSAEVTLAFEEADDPAVRQQARPGLPAVVLFESHSTNPILAAMWRKVAALLL